MTKQEALNRISRMEAQKPKGKELRERITRVRKAVTIWDYIPTREIELIEGALFVASVDNGVSEEESEDST
jgi:hypothetical protein